MLTQIRN